MARGFQELRTTTGVAALVLLAACGQQAEQTTIKPDFSKATECVPVEDGGNYTVINGKFVRTDRQLAPKAAAPTAVKAPDTSWEGAVEASLQSQGYDWIDLTIRRNLATLSGLAPDAEAKAEAFAAGTDAIRATADGERYNIIDDISVEGGEAGVGAALSALTDSPSLAACQKAFVDTMEGRNVQFRVGSATILNNSARLLDAVSGVATLCEAYNIEIGGHTDRIGDPGRNQVLSQNRADSVLAYLESKGVNTASITATGYGATRPIDTSGTRTGDALNRRTEFKVSER
jgi:outer membrane protein OmpA-like peptidoglycan-associated protein